MPPRPSTARTCATVYQTASTYIERARRGEGPAFLQCITYRYHGHHVGDIARAYYRPKAEEQEWVTQKDPVTLHGEWLMDSGVADRAALDAIQEKLVVEMDAAVEFAVNASYPDPSQGDRGHLCPEAATATAAPTRDATRRSVSATPSREAIAEEMRRDPTVVLMGEDVAEAGTTFKVLKGLVEEFGTNRIIDTPISEAGFTGLGVGAAMTGMRPIVDIMFGDFLS